MKTVYKIKMEQTFIPYKITFFRKRIKELERTTAGHEYYYVVASSDQEAIDKAELKSFYYSYNLLPYGNFNELCSGYAEYKDMQLKFTIISRNAQDSVSISLLKKELSSSDFVDFFRSLNEQKTYGGKTQMTKLSYYDLDDILNYAIDFDIKNSDISENDIVELLIDYISSRLNVDNSKAEKVYGFAYSMRRDIGMESICWCVERLIDLIKDVQ